MPQIAVRENEDGFNVTVGGYAMELVSASQDQGKRAGISPMDLLVASWAACMEMRAALFLGHKEIAGHVSVDCDFVLDEDNPDRLKSLEFTVNVPPGIPPGRRAAVVRVVERCATHNPLHTTRYAKVRVREASEGAHTQLEKDLSTLEA